MNLHLRVISLASLPLFLVACTQAAVFQGVQANTKESSPSGLICQSGESLQAVPTKFLFIVDQSGSNFEGPYEHQGDATDPNKTFRYGTISAFVNQYISQTNLQWGFLSFSGTQVLAYINSGDQQHASFSGAGAITSALQTFQNSTDGGATPYRLALSAAHDLIQKDIATSTVKYQYRIAFITDGYPTDYCPDPTVEMCPGEIMDGQLDTDVSNLIALAPQAIQMSTVYYGLPDDSAALRLKNMATNGNGQFVDTNISKTMTLDDIIKVQTTCPQ
jgi:hypothetical protein